jgi:acetyl-CoA acetyltransferase
VRFRLGITNAVYFGLYAQRRMDAHGTTMEDLARVKVKNSRHGLHNPNARYRKEYTMDEIMASNPVATPLRLLDICATSDGGAAVIICSPEYARKLGARKSQVWVSGISTETPTFPMASVEMPYISTDSWVTDAPREFRSSLARKSYEESGISPKDISFAEVYDLSTSLELDWCEDLSLCAPGEADQLLRNGDTSVGGKLPINPSGGLACFGEAVPAQALAQVCEMVWQLRGQAKERQVAKASAAISANQGLFGHGSTTIAHN